MQRDEDVPFLVSSGVCVCGRLLCIAWLENGLMDVVTRVYGHSMFAECLSVGAVSLIKKWPVFHSRCGRIHCYFTGPFFILAAVTSLTYGFGLLPFGPAGWKWIGNITITGAIVLSAIPELILGRYR